MSKLPDELKDLLTETESVVSSAKSLEDSDDLADDIRQEIARGRLKLEGAISHFTAVVGLIDDEPKPTEEGDANA